MSTTKNLILHIGFEKTGSSAIQSLLAINRNNLYQQEIMYIYEEGPALSFRISSGNGEVLTKYLNGSVNEETVLLHYFNHNLKTTIISSEVLLLLWDNRLNKLKTFCEKFNINVCILAYIRNILPFSVSKYHQHLKRHNSTERFSEFIKNNGRLSTQIDLSLQIFSLGFQFKLLSYDSNKHRVFESFCEAANIEYRDLNIPHRRVNRSLSSIEVEAIRQINICAKNSLIELGGYIYDALINEMPNFPYQFKIKSCDFEYIKNSHQNNINNFNEKLSKLYGFELSLGDVMILGENEPDLSEKLDLTILQKCMEIFRNQYATHRRFPYMNMIKFANHIKKISPQAGEIIGLAPPKPLPGKLMSQDATYLKDAALKLEKYDIGLSYLLMALAQRARPHGPFIQGKVSEYLQSLDLTEQ